MVLVLEATGVTIFDPELYCRLKCQPEMALYMKYSECGVEI